MIIGMFPDCDPERIEGVVNAARDGAKLALLDKDMRLEAQAVANFIEVIEISVESDFQKYFLEALVFPHAVDRFPHAQHILEQTPQS